MLKIPLNIQKFASGSFECTASGALQCKVEWSSQVNGSTDAEKSTLNRSTITVRVYARRTDSATTTGTFSGFAAIDNSSMQGTGTWYGSISNNYQLIYTYSNTVSHGQNGSKTVTIYGSATGPSGTSLAGKTSTGNRTVALDNINRYATTNSVNGSDIDGNFSVNYTRYISTYKYKLRVSLPNIVMLERIDYDTSGETFTLSQTTIDTLYNRYTNTNSFDLGFRVETWNSAGTTKLSDGNEIIITGKILNSTPIFTDFEFEDTNATTLALTGDSSINVNGYSNIQATISTTNKAEAQKGATMVKYQFRVGNGTPIDITYSDSANVSGTINNAESGVYNVYAVDSRSNTTLVTKLASQEINYTPISLNATNCYVERNNGGVGANAVLTLSGDIWNDSFGDITNSIKSLVVEYKETSSSTWLISPTTITPTISNNSFSFTGQVGSQEPDYTFNLNKSYDFRISISDELSTKIIQLTPMPSAVPNISIADDGVGIMCDYDDNLGGLLQVGGEKFEISKTVVDYIIPTATHSVSLNIPNSKPTDIYEMYILGSVSNTNNQDIYIQFNDITGTNYYMCMMLQSTSSTSDGNLTASNVYRAGKTAFYVGSILSGNHYGAMKYEFFISDGHIVCNWDLNIFGNNLKGIGKACGVNTSSQTEINKVMLTASTTTSVNFNAGTRILILKK